MQGRKRNLIWQDGNLLSPGRILPGDRVYNGKRVWDPKRSKVAALCHLGFEPPLDNTRVLYLGAAAGTTVSFVADYAEVVYAIEFAYRPVRNLVRLANQRSNIIPFFQDARYPERYAPFVEVVDVLIQDIAQRDQAEIAIKNLFMLKNGGLLILFLKMLSMGVQKEKNELIENVCSLLLDAGVGNIEVIEIGTYHTGHVGIIGIYSSKKDYEKE